MERMEGVIGTLVVVAILAAVIFVAYANGLANGRKETRREYDNKIQAVIRGHARWENNVLGGVSFKWNESEEPQ